MIQYNEQEKSLIPEAMRRNFKSSDHRNVFIETENFSLCHVIVRYIPQSK